jgi:hypothetical protein
MNFEFASIKRAVLKKMAPRLLGSLRMSAMFIVYNI